MIINNLQKRCIDLVGLDPDTYKLFWTRWIDRVDRGVETGFAFIGGFFENETIEMTPATHLILFGASTNQNGYPVRRKVKRSGFVTIYEYHEVLLLLPTGELERTGLITTDDKRWAISLRDQVALWLDKITQAYSVGTPLQLAVDHLFDRMLAVKLGNSINWDQTDVNMVQIILDALENSRTEGEKQ